MTKSKSSTPAFEAVSSSAASRRYVLRLYIAGQTPHSTRAVRNLKAICEEHLVGRYDLEVIDIYQQPTLARDEQILAAPTLIKRLPLPLRRIIGDLADIDRVLIGLDLEPLEKKRGGATPPKTR